MKNNIIDIVSNAFNAKNKWGLVIGDIMLDTYITGDVKRLSPEAPVPIVNVNDSIDIIGGAGNVALNLNGLQIKTLDALHSSIQVPKTVRKWMRCTVR